MTKILKNVLETIGNTPIIELHRCIPKGKHRFFAKVEYFNPGLSVKDRIGLAIIEDAEDKGLLKPGGTIIEATSGNTGLGLGLVAAVRGYKSIFVMPDKISEEKRAILRAFGAKVVITPTAVEADDPRSFYSVAQKLVEMTPNSFYANQYNNPINPKKHYDTTGPEIWDQMDGQVDVVVGGAGTGGTLSGIAKYLKEKSSNVKIVCADPIGSILHDYFYYKEIREAPKPYKVEGIGEDIIPENVHFQYFDDFVKTDDRSAFIKCREIVAKEGLCVGPSSASALNAAIKYSEKLESPSNILVIFADNGRSYLSKAFNEDWLKDNDFMPSILDSKTIEDLLISKKGRSDLVSVEVNKTIAEVVETLKEFEISQVPVCSGSDLVGIIDESDLLYALTNGRYAPNDPIIHLMKGSVIEVQIADSLRKAYDLFQESFTVITRYNNKLSIISKIDLLDFLNETI